MTYIKYRPSTRPTPAALASPASASPASAALIPPPTAGSKRERKILVTDALVSEDYFLSQFNRSAYIAGGGPRPIGRGRGAGEGLRERPGERLREGRRRLGAGGRGGRGDGARGGGGGGGVPRRGGGDGGRGGGGSSPPGPAGRAGASGPPGGGNT